MHLIIDGYNLLAVTGRTGAGAGPLFEESREALLRNVATYCRRKGHPVTVVFDAWQQERPNEGHEHRAGVHVIYSKRGERADQVIQRLAREYGSECAIVSSDHEIVATAKAHGALTMRAQEFAEKLRTAWQASGVVAHKELDPGDDLPPRGRKKKGNPRKLPKTLRQRNRQLRRF